LKSLAASGAVSGESVDARASANETVRRILEAGSACLARFGNEKTSIQDVADAAGVSRATIYRYYPDRAKLFQAVTDREFAQQLDEVRTRADSTGGLEAALAIVSEVIASAVIRFHTRDHLRNRDRGLAQYLYFQQRDRLAFVRTLVRPYVQRAHEAGELTSEVSLEEAVEWIVMGLAMIPTLPPSQALDFDDPVAVGRFFARRLCRGLSKVRSAGGLLT
jgi:AcrR family transcriptional regulator